MNSNADLDRLLKSPVGLAHRSLGGTEYAGKQKYKNKGQVEELFETWHLDVWETNTGRVLTKPRTLDTSHDGWVKAICDPEDGLKPSEDAALKFRVLLTRPPQDGNYPWPKYHDRGRPGHKQIHYLPFFKRDMKALILSWQLPIDWLYLRNYAKGCGNYVRKTIWNEQTGIPERIAFVIHFPYVLSPSRDFTPKEHEKEPRRWDEIFRSATAGKKLEEKLKAEEKFRNGDPFIWSVSLSHHLQNGTTKALFDGFTDRMTEDLCERLQARSCFWSEHPLYLLIVLLDIYVGCTTAQAKDIDYAYHKLDGSRIVEYKAINLFGRNLSNLVDVERMLDFNLQLATFLIANLAYLEEAGIVPDNMSQRTRDNNTPAFQHLINNDRKVYIKLVNMQMKESLSNTIEFLKNHIHFIAGLQKRNSNDLRVLQANLGRIDNLYNKEMSEDSRALAYDAKQDSTSMMTISILTMTFLPATAVAAICSMGVFDWSQPQGVVVSPHFWIFWAVALPLTFALMAGWFAWYFFYRKPKTNLGREKMECRACSKARVVESDLPCEEHRDEFSCWKYWRRNFLPLLRRRAKEDYLL